MRPTSCAFVALCLLSCGPTVRHDLGSVQQGAITFDDMCHLQDYFNARVASHAEPLRVRDEQSTETQREERDDQGRMRRVILGEGTYVLASRTDRVRFRKLIRDEYRRIPEMGLAGRESEAFVRVSWWQAGGIRHVRSDGDVEISVGGNSWRLPPHPCVGEFLFGETAYVMRGCFIESEAARARGEVPGDCSLREPTLVEPVAATDAGSPPSRDSAVVSSVDAAADASADASASVRGDVPVDSPVDRPLPVDRHSR